MGEDMKGFPIIDTGSTVYTANPMGGCLYAGALLVFFLGLAGAVVVSDILDWGRLVGFLLCIVPAVCVSLPLCLVITFRMHQHWVHQYNRR
jgi:hypothetical protein